jgi:uncharacterized protein YuzE
VATRELRGRVKYDNVADQLYIYLGHQ